MILANNLSCAFGKQVLFKEVTCKFTSGNCYGLIGANGSGKSTFLKILAGELEPTQGEVIIGTNLRCVILRQDHFAFDEYTVMDTVIMGHKRLYNVLKERDILYSKTDMTEQDGMRASELESEVADMNGWDAESDAGILLDGLGVEENLHKVLMRDLPGGLKVRVLLAQALFGNPDILLLDEPTNNLDIESVSWLEDFLYRFENTVIVVSHDRHFLNKVCTHIADIDYNKISLYVGNYDFWYQASQLALMQKRNENKKKEDKIAELKSFVARFSANASKARQATSRKKLLENITLEEMPVSSRKFPYVEFKPERECGRNVLAIEDVSLAQNDIPVFKNFNLSVNRGDKIVLLGPVSAQKTALFQLCSSEIEPDSGKITWGVTIKNAYFPKENSSYFTKDISIIDWLMQYTTINDISVVRGFLGRMLFSGEDALKSVTVLSGGERVRCMLSKMMLAGANVLLLDEPTNHLDLESITALNTGLTNFPGNIIFTSHDHQFVSTIANRIIEFTPGGIIDKIMAFDEYLEDADVKKQRDSLYHGHMRMTL